MYEVMVIEDDVDIRSLTIEFLAMEMITANGFANGQLALDHLNALEQPYPKLIIADLDMAVMNGETFRRRQLADESIKEIPFILMSASVDLTEKCRDLGISEIIRKPVDFDAFLAIVRRFL